MAHGFTHFTHILCIILDSSTQLYLAGDTVAVLLTAKSVHNMVAAPWRCVARKQVKPLPSGKRLHNYGEIHHVQWENSLFLWTLSIAMLVITRGYI